MSTHDESKHPRGHASNPGRFSDKVNTPPDEGLLVDPNTGEVAPAAEWVVKFTPVDQFTSRLEVRAKGHPRKLLFAQEVRAPDLYGVVGSKLMDSRYVPDGIAQQIRTLDLHNPRPLPRAFKPTMTVFMADGSTREIPPHIRGRFRGIDDEGHNVVSEPLLGYDIALSKCCNATGKGTEYGIACRNCYREVSWALASDVQVAQPAEKQPELGAFTAGTVADLSAEQLRMVNQASELLGFAENPPEVRVRETGGATFTFARDGLDTVITVRDDGRLAPAEPGDARGYDALLRLTAAGY